MLFIDCPAAKLPAVLVMNKHLYRCSLSEVVVHALVKGQQEKDPPTHLNRALSEIPFPEEPSSSLETSVHLLVTPGAELPAKHTNLGRRSRGGRQRVGERLDTRTRHKVSSAPQTYRNPLLSLPVPEGRKAHLAETAQSVVLPGE